MKPTTPLTLLIAITIAAVSSSSAQNLLWSQKGAPTNKDVYAVAYSPDGSKIATLADCQPAYVRIFNSGTGSLEWEEKLDTTMVGCSIGKGSVKFNSDGSRLIVLDAGGQLLAYDCTTSIPTRLWKYIFNYGNSSGFSLAVAPDGKKIAAGCANRELAVHEINTGKHFWGVNATSFWVEGVAWSVNQQIAAGGSSLTLWDSLGKLVRKYSNNPGGGVITSLAFFPDGSKFIAGSSNSSIRIWDANSDTVLQTVGGHVGAVKSIDLSEDGTHVVSGGVDGTIRIWDISTGLEIGRIGKIQNGSVVQCVDYLPGSTRFIVAGTSKGDVQVWDMMFPTKVKNIVDDLNMRLYPNPASGVLNIDITLDQPQEILVGVTDMLGREIKSRHEYAQKIFETSIDIGDLTPGVYNFFIENENEKKWKKFVVQ